MMQPIHIYNIMMENIYEANRSKGSVIMIMSVGTKNKQRYVECCDDVHSTSCISAIELVMTALERVYVLGTTMKPDNEMQRLTNDRMSKTSNLRSRQ